MLRKTSKALNVLLKLRQEVVPLVLDAENRGVVDFDIKMHPCGMPSCFIGHASDISKRQGWCDQFMDWQDRLWRYDQGLWSSLFGVAASGTLDNRIKRLDTMIAEEMAGAGRVCL
jgi:hypothetical protein